MNRRNGAEWSEAERRGVEPIHVPSQPEATSSFVELNNELRELTNELRELAGARPMSREPKFPGAWVVRGSLVKRVHKLICQSERVTGSKYHSYKTITLISSFSSSSKLTRTFSK